MLKLYKKIEKEHKNEINMVYILSFSSTGLFYHDLDHIKRLNHLIKSDHCMNFGDWDHFLYCQILNKEEIMHDTHEACHKHKHMDIRIITEHFNETLESSKLLVNSLVTYHIRIDALRGGKCIDYARQYICYMSLLSRLLLRYIKKHKL